MARRSYFIRRRRGALPRLVEESAAVEARYAPRRGRRRNLAALWMASPRSKKDSAELGTVVMDGAGYPLVEAPPMAPSMVNTPALDLVSDRLAARPSKKLPTLSRALRPKSKKRRALYTFGLAAPKE
jgi:hypothetical protein